MRILILFLLALSFAGACEAGQDAVIKKNLESRYPGLDITSVGSSPIAGLYEVVVDGSHIIYSDKNANYILDGALVDTATKRNLTQERLEQIEAVNFDSLPLKQAIKIVHGDGKRRLAVFSDPDCPF